MAASGKIAAPAAIDVGKETTPEPPTMPILERDAVKITAPLDRTKNFQKSVERPVPMYVKKAAKAAAEVPSSPAFTDRHDTTAASKPADPRSSPAVSAPIPSPKAPAAEAKAKTAASRAIVNEPSHEHLAMKRNVGIALAVGMGVVGIALLATTPFGTAFSVATAIGCFVGAYKAGKMAWNSQQTLNDLPPVQHGATTAAGETGSKLGNLWRSVKQTAAKRQEAYQNSEAAMDKAYGWHGR